MTSVVWPGLVQFQMNWQRIILNHVWQGMVRTRATLRSYILFQYLFDSASRLTWLEKVMNCKYGCVQSLFQNDGLEQNQTFWRTVKLPFCDRQFILLNFIQFQLRWSVDVNCQSFTALILPSSSGKRLSFPQATSPFHFVLSPEFVDTKNHHVCNCKKFHI